MENRESLMQNKAVIISKIATLVFLFSWIVIPLMMGGRVVFNRFIITHLFYGALAGIISQVFIFNATSIIKTTGIVFLITFLLRIMTSFFFMIVFSIRDIRYLPLGQILGRSFPIWVRGGLLLGVLCAILVFIYLKIWGQKIIEENAAKSNESTFERGENQDQSRGISVSGQAGFSGARFTGGVLPIFLSGFWIYPFTLLTLGIATPWITCIILDWICRNTEKDGKRFRFNGTGGGLFGRYIIWWLLTVITFGIYSFWATRNMIRWVVNNIEIEAR